MKAYLVIFVFSLAWISTIQAQIIVQWSDAIEVSSTPLPVTAPRVQLFPDGTPLITWGTSGNPARIWCSRYENNQFSTPVSVVQAPNQPDLFGFGGYDVAISNNEVYVVFEQSQVGILLAKSPDGGLTFNAPIKVQAGVSGGYNTLSSITIDGTGNPVVSYILDKNGATYQVRRSTDGGQTFGDAVLGNAVSPGGLVCECCTADLLASGDSIWMVYRNNNQNLRDIWVSRSTDLAATFDTATDVDSTDWILNFCPIAGPQLARAGDSLVSVWTSGASGKGRVYLSSLHAGTMGRGIQMAFPAQLDANVQSQADVTASGDTIGVVFVEKTKELFFHYSLHGTADLPNQSTRFADANHTLQYPSLAFRHGMFHLVYTDPNSDKVLYRRGTLTESSAVTEPTESFGLKMHPNPTTGATIVALNGQSALGLTLLDLRGRTVQHLTRATLGEEDTIALNLEGFPAGLYFVRLETHSGWRWGKVVKH